MTAGTSNPAASRGSARMRVAFAAIAIVAAAVHVRAAQMRSLGLLEHDEAISLLAAAGKSIEADALYADQSADSPVLRSAASLQSMLRPTGDTGFGDVVRSLRDRDIHPPLYFWLLHAAERCGFRSETALRLIGSVLLLMAAVIFDRLVWPDANRIVRLLAFALLLLSPALIATATELRQYALVTVGIALSIAGLVRVARPSPSSAATVAIVGLAPGILLWAHLGTLIWVAVWSVGVIIMALFVRPRPTRAYAWSVVIATISIGLLLIIVGPLLLSRGADAHPNPPSFASACYQILSSTGQPLMTLPWRWQQTRGAASVFPLAIALAVLLRGRRMLRVDGALLAIVGIWLIAWVALLSIGKLPSHAMSPKYLLAPSLAVLAVLVRVTMPSNRCLPTLTVMSFAWLAMLTHLAALPTLLTPPGDARIAAALYSARTVFVNDPKRGYLFPIVDKLPSSAEIKISRPMRVPDESAQLKSPVLVLEIHPAPNTRSNDGADRLHAALTRRYEYRETLADGPRRRMTLYRGSRE